jgi:hypothetical protein
MMSKARHVHMPINRTNTRLQSMSASCSKRSNQARLQGESIHGQYGVMIPPDASWGVAGKELTHLLHAISARFQASGHCTPILFAFGGRVARRHSPIEFSGIESGLTLGPTVAFIAIGRLLLR